MCDGGVVNTQDIIVSHETLKNLCRVRRLRRTAKENLNEKTTEQPVYKPFDVQHTPCSAKSVGRKQHEIRHGIYADSGAYMRHFNVFIRQSGRCKP